MASTLQRLTLYALLSALENDLRDFLILHVMPLLGERPLLPDALASKATERFRRDVPHREPTSEDLIEYIDLTEEISIIRSHDGRLDDGTRSYIKRFYTALEGIAPTRNRVMHSRPLEFDDLSRVTDLTSELVRSHRALWANLRTLRRDLENNPQFVSSIVIPGFLDDDAKILHNLPQVDFDDTGFIGREKELNELRKALSGSYPVVTIVGEGGLGKTSLALRACYEIIDDEASGLDAVVWTTAKTSRLTVHEIEVIEGAISSSLGLIESASTFLGRQGGSSALDDLLLHLKNNKVLLIIDNLETVIDHTIRDLVRRIPAGSRILFTTRIGLGAFDFPIALSPLNGRDAANYFRRAAKVWGVFDLANATPVIVEGFCQRLQSNPLLIKWFMQSVRAGVRPTNITSDPDLFLRFCLQTSSTRSLARRKTSR